MSLFAKPFVKWAGGKYKLSETILQEISKEIDLTSIDKYIDPFVGGGGMFFSLMNMFDFKETLISDINKELINTYISIRDNLPSLVQELDFIQDKYNSISSLVDKKLYYLELRNLYNNTIKNSDHDVVQAALFIALNKLSFNGLYRVNSKGLYNVPFGKKMTANLYEYSNLLNVSDMLSNTEIKHADYKTCTKYVTPNSLVYFDSPYRPLPNSASFTTYASSDFNDNDQIELANTAKEVAKLGGRFFLSNSDPKQIEENDNFFDDLYRDFTIKRIDARRSIGATGDRRGMVSEILVIG